MSDVSIRGIDQLVALLRQPVEQIGHLPLFAYHRSDRWDFWRPWVEDPLPVIQPSLNEEDQKIQIYLGGRFSPARAGDPPIQYAAFVDGLAKAAQSSQTLPMYAAGVMSLPGEDGEEYQATINAPIRSMKLMPLDRAKRVRLMLYAYRP